MRHLPLLVLTFATLLGLCATSSADHPANFGKAKKTMKRIYQGHQTSFYCGCRYDYQGKKGVPYFNSCDYQPRKPNTKSGKRNSRIDRIEWEHVVPAWEFGHQMQCWREGKRRKCGKDPKFRRMESDMHNLTPALGEVNGDRGNFQFTMLSGVGKKHGQCDVKVDFKAKRFQPPPNRRGDIARTYFYFRDRYGLSISRQQRQLYEAWSRQDPVDQWERERNQRIQRAQGNGNAYVSGRGRVERAPGFEGGIAGNAPRCDRKKTRCSQMKDCAEARHYLTQCGRKSFDRNKDGVPCESLCR